MSLIEPTMYNSALPTETVNGEQELLNRISGTESKREQLKKVAKEFEAVFISKMFSCLDKTVDREDGIFGEDSKYYDTFKSYMYNELGRELSNSPRTTFGFAKQVYEQMERYVKD